MSDPKTKAGDGFVHVGVLAIQGGFKEIAAALARQPGVVAHEVRTPTDLSAVSALVLPGGESTSIGHGLELAGLLEPLKTAITSRKLPVFGICAGLILLANKLDRSGQKEDVTPSQPLIGGLDVTAHRNHFGRQSQSRFRQVSLTEAGRAAALHDRGYFIRAPAITTVGENVEVLAEVDGVAVAVREGPFLAVSFHPEAIPDDTYLQYFLAKVAGYSSRSAAPGSYAVPPTFPIAFGEAANTAGPMIGLGAPSLKTGATQVLSRSVLKAFPLFQQGGVIMDVVNGEQARIAENAGAVSVMALERIPADIKKDGGLARMSDPAMILDVMANTSLPVMAKARIGHFAEARVLEALNVDCIDESEVLTPADETHHIDKRGFSIPFVCGAKNLGEALRRIAEGASMIRLKGNAGTGNVVQAVRHARAVFAEIRQLSSLRRDELFVFAKQHAVPVELVEQVRDAGRLPVVTFAAGGLATPADVALLMHLGCDGVFVGSGIFKGENPEQRARAMVQAATHFRDARVIARVSTGLGKAMVGILDHGESYAAMGVNSDSLL